MKRDGKYKDLGEKILSTLVELYADQMGVEVDYTIVDGKDRKPTPVSGGLMEQEVKRCG